MKVLVQINGSGPSLEGILANQVYFRFPDFRIILLVTAFPTFLPVATFATFVPGYSGGAVLDSHQLPLSKLDLLKVPVRPAKIKFFKKN